MSYRRGHEPSVDFDFSLLDEPEAGDVDTEFWRAQSELLADILRWVTVPRTLAGAGARCYALVLYLNPSIITQRSLREICSMSGSPCVSALSKAMLEFQERYALKPSYYQKPVWMRERFRRSAIIAHEQRSAQNKTLEDSDQQAQAELEPPKGIY
jgi:hypothetical protein